MPNDLTSAPQTDPLNIYRYRDSLYAVDLITAALSLDFFTWLSANPSSLSGICDHFGFKERPVDVMLTSDAAPLLAVDVCTGVVVAVDIDTCAKAGMTNTKGAAAPSSRRTLKVMRAVYS